MGHPADVQQQSLDASQSHLHLYRTPENQQNQNHPEYEDRFGLGISWRGSQAVKSTQTEDLEEIVGEGDAEGDQDQGKEGKEEEVKGKKSILASKLAKLLSFNQ